MSSAPPPDYVIYSIARGLLEKTEDQLPYEFLPMREQITFTVPLLLTQLPGVADYSHLAGPTKDLFDGAASRVIAARLRPGLLAAENNGKGAVIETEFAGTRTRYANYNATASGSKKTVEEGWLDEAQAALTAVVQLLASASAAATPRRACRTGGFFATPGRRRTEEHQSGYRAVDLRDLLLPHSR